MDTKKPVRTSTEGHGLSFGSPIRRIRDVRSTEHEARSRMDTKKARHGRARKDTDCLSVLLIAVRWCRIRDDAIDRTRGEVADGREEGPVTDGHGRRRIFLLVFRSLYASVESVTMRSTEHEARSRMDAKKPGHGRARKDTDVLLVLPIAVRRRRIRDDGID